MDIAMSHPWNLSKWSENVIAHQKKTPDSVKTILITQTFQHGLRCDKRTTIQTKYINYKLNGSPNFIVLIKINNSKQEMFASRFCIATGAIKINSHCWFWFCFWMFVSDHERRRTESINFEFVYKIVFTKALNHGDALI